MKVMYLINIFLIRCQFLAITTVQRKRMKGQI